MLFYDLRTRYVGGDRADGERWRHGGLRGQREHRTWVCSAYTLHLPRGARGRWRVRWHVLCEDGRESGVCGGSCGPFAARALRARAWVSLSARSRCDGCERGYVKRWRARRAHHGGNAAAAVACTVVVSQSIRVNGAGAPRGRGHWFEFGIRFDCDLIDFI